LKSHSKPAPIVLTAYNRPDLLEKAITALRANDLAAQTECFAFSDGPKSGADNAGVRQVRSILRTTRGFKSLAIVERKDNWGLARSVIAGVTQILAEFDSAIVVEDDIVVTPDFLTFMNAALRSYANDQTIYSVSGFNFGLRLPETYPYDGFCFYRSSSLGWGTWKDRWSNADWTMAYYKSFCSDKLKQQQFNRGGNDLSYLLRLQASNRIDSWAIRWAYTHFERNALALLSSRPLVRHIGSGERATHSRWKSFAQLPLTTVFKEALSFAPDVAVDRDISSKLRKLFRPSIPRRIVRFSRELSFKTSVLCGFVKSTRTTEPHTP
jgi:GNT-I family protein